MADNQHSLATYVSDMLALERHIRIPFETQKKDGDFADFTDALEIVSRLCSLADAHVDSLKKSLDGLGGHEASPLKSAVVEAEGAVAGAIDKMRKTKVSKALRDDYTALSLCSAGYSALLATANAMAQTQVSTLAQRLLRDYAECIMQIGEALPNVVVHELRVTGLDVNESTIAVSQSQIQQSWQHAGRQQAGEAASGHATIDAGMPQPGRPSL